MKKNLKTLFIIIGCILILCFIFFMADYSRVKQNKNPIFCILKDEANDGGTKIYLGLGYKVIDFNTLSGFNEMKIGTWFMEYNDFDAEIDSMKETVKLVVVKVNSNNLLAMEAEDTNNLYSIGLKNAENIEFKKDQEILVYCDGMILTTYPASFANIGRIEIIKEKSDIEIPENILKYCYRSKENVKVTLNELTKNSITITIVDTNEIPYNYSNDYTIYKKVKNENYTGEGEKIGKDTENSTAGFTRNWK